MHSRSVTSPPLAQPTPMPDPVTETELKMTKKKKKRKKKLKTTTEATAITDITTTTEEPSPVTETPTPKRKFSFSAFSNTFQPKFDAHHTGYFFLGGAAFFTFLSLVAALAMRNVQELVIDYTNCRHSREVLCVDVITSPLNNSCWCTVRFSLDSDVSQPVYLYYQLTNFYQNHRNYVLSKDFLQLQGNLSAEVVRECKPYDYIWQNGTRKTIAPCGAIANSMFTDSITLYSNQLHTRVPLLKTNLVWSNIKSKFRNPAGNLKEAFRDYAKPPCWKKNIWELDEDDPSNNGFENEDFIVWMQPATRSSFRKLYRRVDHDSESPFKEGLLKGNYTLDIDYSFPVASFQGTKSIIIANASLFGGRNMFIIQSSLIIACICLLIGVAFTIIKIRKIKIDFF